MASTLHNECLEFLKKSIFFKNYRLVSEYPVKKINPHCKKNLFIDIVIPELRIAIELQGEQHTKPVNFGGRSDEESEYQLRLQQERDTDKKAFVEEAGWALIYLDKTSIKSVKWQQVLLDASSQITERAPQIKKKTRFTNNLEGVDW